jgi:hypothetical protein
MRTNLTIAVALIAGCLGGFASRYWGPALVYAKTQAPAPAEIRAQKFVLVDENGAARGVFGFEANGSPVIEITSDKGHVFTTRWYGAGPGPVDFHNPPAMPRKTTLLP